MLLSTLSTLYINVAENVYGHDIIVSADTIVVYDDIIIGKPKDEDDAFSILKKLSGNTHFVETCVFILKLNYDNENFGKKHMPNNYLYDIDRTYVTFRKLTNDKIVDYINKYKPLDKAGAYGIQDNNFDFIEKIDGNRDNVIGFPVDLFERLLREII